jgi:hypothetical protein
MFRSLATFTFNDFSNTAISKGGWYVVSNQTVNALAGNDKITGRGGIVGIQIEGKLDTGSGNDEITGTGADANGDGIYNTGTIDTGLGKDSIIGIGPSVGVYNNGNINTGKGNDLIKGTGRSCGIQNDRIIDTGAGDDIIDALKGGFSGIGQTYLGSGNDTLKGFVVQGSQTGFKLGTFDGGSGTDRILLGQGTYTITASSITSGGLTMTVNEFEKVGGANGGLFNLANGTLTVAANGVASLAA